MNENESAAVSRVSSASAASYVVGHFQKGEPRETGPRYGRQIHHGSLDRDPLSRAGRSDLAALRPARRAALRRARAGKSA